MSTTDTTPQSDLVTLTVNGTEFQAPKGANLLRTLLAAGFKIPHYCYHPALTVDGTCRLCFVQMEGDPRLHVSCNMKAADGLKILTDTETIREARQGMMEFLLANHPLDCPICDKGGECLLQRYSMDHGIGDARMSDQRRRYPKPQFDPLIDLERNRCILCSRCVRFCDEIAENHVLGIVERGDRNRIASFGDGPISSIYSGNVIDLCPVGALTSKPFRFHARSWEMQQIVTSCVHCSSGCAMTAWARDGKVYRVTTPVVRKDDTYTVKEDTTEFICNIGRFASDFGHSERRILKAGIRRDGKLADSTVTEAIDAAASLLKGAAEKYGPEAIGFLAGPRATNEELYLLQKIARQGIGTSHIDWRVHLDSAEACAAHSSALAASNGTLDDLETSQCVLVIESDLSATTPILALKVKEAAKHGKNRTILMGSVVDEFIAKYASHSIVKPAEEVMALLEKALPENGEGNGDAEANALVETLHSAQSGLIVLGLSEQSGALLPQLVPLVLKLKNHLEGEWKLLAVPGERNSIGAFAVGCQNDRVLDASNTTSGMTAPEMIAAAAEGKIKALYVLGQDLLNMAPDQKALRKALVSVEVLIVQDVFPGMAATMASVVIPGALFTEKNGSFVNAGGDLARLVKGYEPPNGVVDELEVLARLATAFGVPTDGSANAIFSEFVQLLDPSAPRNLDEWACDQPGEEWPLRVRPNSQDAGKPSYKVIFGGHAQTAIPEFRSSSTKPPLLVRWTWNVSRSGHLADQSPSKTKMTSEKPVVRMSNATALKMGFVDGQHVEISSEDGEFEPVASVVRITSCIAEGIIHVAGNDFTLSMLNQPVLKPLAE